MAISAFALGFGGGGVARASGWLSIPDAPGQLGAVSCVSRIDCIAAGYQVEPDGFGGRAAEWNGTRWTVQRVQPSVDPTQSSFIGVSCSSATACTAVGGDYGAAGETTVAERWDGTSWTIQPTANVNGAGATELDAVSCPSTSACVAVGRYDHAFSGPQASQMPLSEGWDGTSWRILSTPGVGQLESVSCTSATACTAVGTTGTDALVERWDGISWTVEPTPNPGPSSATVLGGVSCTSATDCRAVGGLNNSLSATAPSAPLAERWDGSHWVIQPTPVPGLRTGPLGPNGGWLGGISCVAATNCVAVGSSTRLRGFAEVWSGSTWTFELMPRRTGSAALAVSCWSAVGCLGVGGGLSNAAETFSGVPSNRFSVRRVTVQTGGATRLTLRVPGPGGVDVLETAWNDNLAEAALLQPARNRFVFGRLHFQIGRAGTLTRAVRPTPRGLRLIRDHRYRVTLRLWVTYTPIGGRSRTTGLYGLHPA